jgi:peptide/nickel transport system permease protein
MLILISIVFFLLINAAPGGPLGGRGQARHIRPEQMEMLKRQLGLDQPIHIRYITWLIGNDWMRVDSDGDHIAESYGEAKGILRGDFGFSYRNREDVLVVIGQYLPNTIYLMTITLVIVILIAIPIGVLSAVKQYSVFDFIATTFAFMGQAMPEFWVGMMLILIFYAGLNWLPAGGMATLESDFSITDRIMHLILPVTMGGLSWVTWYSRFLRSSMLDTIHQDYIRTARAKGLTQAGAVFKHALRNALLPLVTIFTLDLPAIFAGSLYVEILFSWPGMGRLYYQAATDRDYPLLMAILIIGTLLVILSNILADILYAFLDPRIRFE